MKADGEWLIMHICANDHWQIDTSKQRRILAVTINKNIIDELLKDYETSEGLIGKVFVRTFLLV